MERSPASHVSQPQPTGSLFQLTSYSPHSPWLPRTPRWKPQLFHMAHDTRHGLVPSFLCFGHFPIHTDSVISTQTSSLD